jgi:ATP-dependent helicase/DNAse subunit B
MTEPLRLSVSKTKCFNQCKKQFEFNYILKMPKKEMSYHILGKFCHRVLEVFHQYYIEGCLLPYNHSMSDAFKVAWAEYKEKMNPEMKQEAWNIIDRYLHSVSAEKTIYGIPANVIAVEKKFEFPLVENIILNGAIDIIRLGVDDVLEVADFKTTKNPKYLKDDWFQLATYGFILVSERPEIKKIRASYIMLRHNSERLTKEFSVDELLDVKQKYINYANQIRTEQEYKANPTILCGWCDFLEHCPEGKEKVNSNQSQSHKVYGEVSW